MDAHSANLSYTYDELSNVWLEPLSVILNCMLPVEYIYADWFRWVIKDEVFRSEPEYVVCRQVTQIETGSQAEGFCIPEMRVFKNTDHFPQYENGNLFADTDHWLPDHDVMELKKAVDMSAEIFNEVVHCPNDPRYLKLKISDDWKKIRPAFKDVTYLHHSYLFPENFTHDIFNTVEQNSKDKSTSWSCDARGPVRKLKSTGNSMMKYEDDDTKVFKYPQAWPEPAMEWLVRPRGGSWPSPDLIQEIVESGCHIAPVGRGKREYEPQPMLDYLKKPTKDMETGAQDGDTNVVDESLCEDTATNAIQDSPIMDETEWRLSFSVAENLLAQSVTPVQRHIMVLLKMIKKMYFPEVGVSTYLLKNLMFWEIEKQNKSFWREDNSAKCLLHMLDQLEKNLEEGFVPHYIMPKSNLLTDEDPTKLEMAVALIREVRGDILLKVITMFQRCCALWFNAAMFHREIYFEQFQQKLQDESLSNREVCDIVVSLLNLFINRCKACIESMHRRNAHNESDTEKEKRSICMIINIYESLVVRCLTKLWLLQYPASDHPEMFINFVENESSTYIPSQNLIQLALIYFQQATKGKDLSDLVPTTESMENIKLIFRTEEIIALNNGKAFTHFLTTDALRNMVEEIPLDVILKDFVKKMMLGDPNIAENEDERANND